MKDFFEKFDKGDIASALEIALDHENKSVSHYLQALCYFEKGKYKVAGYHCHESKELSAKELLLRIHIKLEDKEKVEKFKQAFDVFQLKTETYLTVAKHGYIHCNSNNCSHKTDCANHISSGDFRSEGGMAPDLVLDLENSTLSCTKKETSEIGALQVLHSGEIGFVNFS